MNESGTCTITVDLGIVLARHASGLPDAPPKLDMTLTGRVTLRELVNRLGLPEKYIGFITVNGVKSHWSTIIKSGDKIILFPYVTGG